ncbi:P-loop containing nucleoside triphosphate hydrolase protein [Marasmius fiardii PR-910]|nr:P-loop containing nucleoside triphosphate hydrolase protein [Marasmius fiardii PR-910]
MDSDDYFNDTDLDEDALNEIDAIEAAHTQPSTASLNPKLPTDEDSSFDDSFDFDVEILDKALAEAEANIQPLASTTYPLPTRTSSKGTLQTTLYGGVLPVETPTSKKQPVRLGSTSSRAQQRRKKWDHTEFAKSGWKKGKSKGKAAEDDVEEEAVEFEQFPAPFPPPMKLKPDLFEAKYWIYPLNQPKRDYQYNIVKNALFDNTIVALPTGMGKTFVAGVIMLNLYRWFPEGKVVFVAPTKPLVAQQIEACHRTCGIPGSDAAELTGEIPKVMRNRLWKAKRVFYMTPQTLINDLTSENCDARDIILLVIASGGDYAYNQVIRYMMAKNPHFRVLALTATPGSTSDAVQNIVDGLHISRIEIRDENSLDLRPYIHEKEVKQHIIKMSPDIVAVRDHLTKLMDELMSPLVKSNIIYSVNPQRVHPFYFKGKSDALRGPQKWAFIPLLRLQSLARCMGYLIEGTISMCYSALQGFVSEATDESSKKGKGQKSLIQMPHFKQTLEELEKQAKRGFSNHPKMDKMVDLIIQHFGKRMGEPGDQNAETRAMVFVTNRQVVDEIVAVLDSHRPLLRASRFIGQGTDARGEKGQAQKEQLDVIKRFKANEFNVLVATSIGEEGLDIGEVDFIICYDAQKTPIRMLQRLGRTGRKRAGVVHVLLSEGREEQNLEKAKTTYKEVQKSIVRGDQVELFEDVERLLPEHVRPQCVEKHMDIQEYVRETGRSRTAKAGPSEKQCLKRKRNDDIGRNIPAGASTGFVSVAKLFVKQKTKKQKTNPAEHEALPLPKKSFEEAGEDDDTDREIEAGILDSTFLRKSTTTAVPSSSKRKETNPKLRKSKTAPVKGTNTKRSRKKMVPELSASQLQAKGADDSDDMDIERGIDFNTRISLPPNSPSTMDFKRGSSAYAVIDEDVIDINDDDDTDSDNDIALGEPATQEMGEEKMKSFAWLVDDEDEDVSFQIIDSSPVAPRSKITAQITLEEEEDSCPEFVEGNSWDVQSPDRAFYHDNADDSVEFVEQIFPSPLKTKTKVKASRDSDIENESPDRCGGMLSPPMPIRTKDTPHKASSPPYYPEPSFDIRQAGIVRKRAVVMNASSPAMEIDDSPQPTGQRRIRKRGSVEQSPLIPRQHKKKTKMSHHERQPLVPAKNNPYYQMEAEHSGDEVSVGSSSDSDEDNEAAEEDRCFLEELPETQVSPSYDQSLVYRESLLTQAPMGGPAFAGRPLKRGRISGVMSNKRRKGVSSSPPPDVGESPDEYEFGSFVVDDEAEIVYD